MQAAERLIPDESEYRMTTSTEPTTDLTGPALMAEGLRRIAEADAAFAAGAETYPKHIERFGGGHATNPEFLRLVYVPHLRETGTALILAAQTAAMVASGVHLPDGEQQAWRDACAGVDRLNRPAADRGY